jgi:hypothetical protein
LTELLVMKEKMEMEREDLLLLPELERDEGRILELEDNLRSINMEVESINQTLDMLDETL